MSFQPLHDYHAIEQVAFTLDISPGIEWSERIRVRGAHSQWSDLLPRVNDRQGPVVAMIARQASEPPPPPPLEFQRFSSDGFLAWRLLLVGPTAAVHCRAYTGWRKIWSQTQSLLVQVSELLERPDRHLTSMSLEYVNVFRDSGPAHATDPASVLNPDCPHLPSSALQHGRLWHAYTGWFTRNTADPGRRLLRRMHIDGLTNANNDALLKMTAFLRLDMSDAVPLSGRGFPNCLDQGFGLLHARAKEFLSEFLTGPMAARISLHAS